MDDVLIQDGGQSNLTDGIRPDGIRTAKNHPHAPRMALPEPARGQAVIDGVAYTVIGDPRPTRAA